MERKIVQPSVDERGDESHPAYAVVSAARVSSSKGTVLFDSEIVHRNYVVLRVNRASTRRDLNRNWVHEDGRWPLIEVAMSEAQWASMVSSLNTSPTPCTLTGTSDEPMVPAIPFKPVLGESMAETRRAAEEAFSEIREAMATYEAALKAPAKERNEALSHLRAAINNAVPNVAYAAKTLNEHTENVITKAKADIEAMVATRAQQLGLEAAPKLELE